MKKGFRTIGIILAIAALVAVRIFEDEVFYDPLLEFFKGDYKTMPLPKLDMFTLNVNLAYRYFLNTFFSLLVLGLAFWNWGVVKFSAFLYLGLFLLLLPLFNIVFFASSNGEGYLMLFYVRRFLIQPLLLLLLLPAFYFQIFKSG